MTFGNGSAQARGIAGISMMRDYVVETTDGSAATMKIATREMIDAGFDTTWLAMDETYTDKFRKTHPLQVPLFPRYLFVAFDVADEGWKRISRLRDVKRLIGAGDPFKPTAMPLGAVDQLKMRFRAGEFKLKPLAGIVKGDRVVFEAGPFAGHVGVVNESLGERLKVLMSLFGAEREVPIRSDMVRRAVS